MLLIRGILENAAAVASDAVAATLVDDAITFGEIDRTGNRLAHALVASGVGRGDRILWWGDTSLEAIPVFAAAAKIGAVFAPLNARASLEEITPVEIGRAHV
jgi:acyl-CoA synthetase (AMP-forming)/AMP-acid ligase II